MTRVLFIADHLGYDDGVVHGGTVYVTSVFPAMVGKGIELTCIFLGAPHPTASVLREARIPVSFLGLSRWNPAGIVRLWREARRFRPAVLHLSGQKASLLGRIVARVLGVPALIHVHDLRPVPWPLRLAYRLFRGQSDQGIAVSGAVATAMASRYALAGERIHVLWNGLPERWFSAVAPSEAVPTVSADVVLVIGRFYPVKGQLRLIDMAPELLRRHSNAEIWFAGDGPLLPACRARAGSLGIADRVKFLGQRDDVQQLIQASAIVAVPSDSEGLSIAAIEAAAVGRAVVSFDSGGTEDVVSDGQTGLLATAGDNAAFAAALDRLLGDARLRERLGAEARARARRFSLAQHVERLAGLYRGSEDLKA